MQNLTLINNLLLENEIFFFLEGRTLKSIFENQQFDLNDHDDDIGIFYTDKEKIYNLVDSFKQLGFEIILLCLLSAFGFTSGTTRGTSFCILK